MPQFAYRHTSNGFTIVELIVVIVLLGVLAAFAVPRFANLQGSAYQAVFDAQIEVLRSTARSAHSLSIVQQLGPNDPVVMEGASVQMIGHYPDAIGITVAANFAAHDKLQFQQFGVNAIAIWASGTPGWTSCGFAYIRAVPPTLPAPTILGPMTRGC